MVQHIRSVTYENAVGQWHIEIDYEDDPRGDDLDTEVYLFKVKGPSEELFTYKIRFSKSAIATVRLNLGHTDDKEKRISIGLKKACELVDMNQFTDLIITRNPRGWDVENAPKPLIKHSSSRGQITE